MLYLITGGWFLLSVVLAPVVGRWLKTSGEAAHDAVCPCAVIGDVE